MAKNLFNSIKMTKPKSNFFDLTHDVKLSLDMGNLVPVCCMECIPGDKFNISCDTLLRFQPLIAPVMHRLDMTVHYFFVPSRILWPDWEKWIFQQGSVGQLPYFNIDKDHYSRLADYLGIPTPPSSGGTAVKVSALPFAAYQKIYNDFYRDENLVTDVLDEPLAAGDNSSYFGDQWGVLRKRAWKHDYFTSALPWAQKGAAVDLPLGSVELRSDWRTDSSPKVENYADDPDFEDGSLNVVSGDFAVKNVAGTDVSAGAYDPDGSLEVQPTTINDLRRASKLQQWLEKNARGGTRLIEGLLVHFGVKNRDARLQRPEYITGVKSPVMISEVLNTSGAFDPTDPNEPASRPQGDMAGHALATQQGKAGSYFASEHGYIIGIMSVMPLPAYQQGVPRHFLKTDDPFEYFWPDFAHIGEQEVRNNELYAYTANGDKTFGYVPRYAEYKYEPSRVAGDLRDSLSFWHFGRKFANLPTLSQTFIECVVDKAPFAVVDQNTDSLIAHVLNKVTAYRRMPKFGNPGGL